MMKSLIVIVSLLLASANCEFEIPEEFRNAKDISESPKMQETLKNLFPEIYDSDTVGKKPFIIGGVNATLGQIPHQVLIFIQVNSAEIYMCGGSLITGSNNRTWVVTAAHCADFNYQRISLLFGLINSYVGPYQWNTEVTSSSVTLHPNYNSGLLTNDIALIRIYHPDNLLTYSYINDVTLPTNYRDTNLVGMNGTVSGWGKYNDSSSSSSTLLKYVQLPIIANSNCTARYGSNVFRDSNICAGTTRTASTCSGDSGGPLTVQISNQTILVGIVSFGAESGCELGYEVAFTRVSSYLSWISNSTSLNETFTTTTTTTIRPSNTTTTTIMPSNTTTTQRTTTATQDAMKNGVNLILVILIQIFLFARK